MPRFVIIEYKKELTEEKTANMVIGQALLIYNNQPQLYTTYLTTC